MRLCSLNLKLILLAMLSVLLSACADYGMNVPEENLDSLQVPARVAASPSTDLTSLSLLVPLEGDFNKAGQAVRNGYLNAYYQANISQTTSLHVVNSQATANILSLYQQTVSSNKPTLIVGPLTKNDVTALAKEALLSTPVLALNHAEVDGSVPSNFYQFSLDPQVEAQMVAERMQQQGYRQVYVIAPKSSWGQSIAASFGKAWLALGGAIVDSGTYQSGVNFTSDAQTLFANPGPSTDHVAIFLVASALDARTLVPIIRNQPIQVPIFALPGVYSGVPNIAANSVLNGVMFPTTAWQLDANSGARQSFANLYPDASEDELRLYGFGMDAFALSQYYLAKQSFEGLNIAGYSGQLTLGESGVIDRHLIWATFVAGIGQRLGN